MEETGYECLICKHPEAGLGGNLTPLRFRGNHAWPDMTRRIKIICSDGGSSGLYSCGKLLNFEDHYWEVLDNQS
ncbi:MAG: hypothetical protein ABIB79_01170 [archaeon]